MNKTSGRFTASQDGSHLFQIDGHKCEGNPVAEIDVQHNGLLIHKIYHKDDGSTSQATQLTSFWTVDMKIGDQVVLSNKQDNSLYIKGNPAYYSFSFIGRALV